MPQSDVMNLITSFLNAYSINAQSKEQKSVKNAINRISTELKKIEKTNKKNQMIIAIFSIGGSVGLTLLFEHFILKIL